MDDKEKEKLDKFLRADPIDLAEQVTGKSSHDDELTGILGLGMAMSINKEKARLLKEADDTYYSMLVGEFSAVLIRNGFTKILTIPFMGEGCGNEPAVQEYFYCFWNREKSILVKFDTFNGSIVNSSTAYFNWLVYEGMESLRYSLPINGGGTGHPRFMGTSIDSREGFIRYLERMEVIGEFLKKWETPPFLWLLHYMDTRDEGYDYRAINKERISQFPGDVIAIVDI